MKSINWAKQVKRIVLALTLAVAQRRLGALDRAQASLDYCRTLCAEHQLAGVRVRVTRREPPRADAARARCSTSRSPA